MTRSDRDWATLMQARAECKHDVRIHSATKANWERLGFCEKCGRLWPLRAGSRRGAAVYALDVTDGESCTNKPGT